MPRSRTRSAILFILFLAIGFGVLIALLSALFGDDSEDRGLMDLLIGRPQVAVVPIVGGVDSADETLKLLKKYTKKTSIKAIILRIDSPGGAVAPAQELYTQIAKIKKKKPVVASMQTVAASAAYYIASAADRVVCSKGTITGSIGVIMIVPNIKEVTEKIGFKVNVIKAGKFKDIGSMIRPMTDPEREYLETFAKEVHDQFIDDVAKARAGKIKREKLLEIADGRFFTGEKALELGLVDSLGNFYDAVDRAAELAKIEDPKLVYPKEDWNYLDMFLQSMTQNIVDGISKFHSQAIAPSLK